MGDKKRQNNKRIVIREQTPPLSMKDRYKTPLPAR